jgi:GntR family transcriptional regulator / MocR family aminotransferase
MDCAMIESPTKKLITLNKSESQSLHLQIYNRFKQAIESKLLRNGDRVPSTRTLSIELGVSRGTVENAYSMLLGEGIFISKGQTGTFVNAPFPFDKNISEAPQNSFPKNIVTPIPSHSLGSRDKTLIFLPGCPAYDAFPRKLWSRLASNKMRSLSSSEMAYNEATGYMPLRNSISTYLRLSRGVECDPKQVLITAGYQGALDFLCKVLRLNNKEVWMEDPGYLYATKLLEDIGAKVVKVPVDKEGLVVEEGIKKSPHAKVAVVTPSHHSPLGMAMSWSRRVQLLDWASSNLSWIVEDDYDGEYRYSGHPLPSLKSLDQYDRVIYAGTFSKTVFPSLRLGYIVLPQNLVDICAEKASFYQISNSIGSQLIVNDFIAEGHFSKHLNKMRVLYSHRREIASNSLTEILGKYVEVNTYRNGMHLVANIISDHSDKKITTNFNKLGYNIHALSNWTTNTNQNGLIIGFTNVPNKKIADLASKKLYSCFL